MNRDDSPVEVPAPAGLSATTVCFGTQEVLILSFPIDPPTQLPGLTEAEQEVVEALLDGKSNQAIAEQRGTAVRTVANQLAAIYKKLSVQSRGELVARLSDRSSRNAR